ncbi:MAG: UvrB/UvrC motif-containing protein [Saccharofermentanales bacterium]|jgi:protein arginine kinase activator
MKCDRCQQNEASVHISQNINGEQTEQNLCQACAHDIGMNSQFQSFSPFFPSGIFGGSIFNTTGGIPAFGGTGTISGSQLVCPNCGTTFEGFRKSGLFGCAQCYDTFREKLDPVLRRVQGGTRHVGRTVCETPESKEQIILKTKTAELRKSLAAAVKREEYEEAARLRDEIHALEARLCDQQETDSSDTGGKQNNSAAEGEQEASL